MDLCDPRNSLEWLEELIDKGGDSGSGNEEGKDFAGPGTGELAW